MYQQPFIWRHNGVDVRVAGKTEFTDFNWKWSDFFLQFLPKILEVCDFHAVSSLLWMKSYILNI